MASSHPMQTRIDHRLLDRFDKALEDDGLTRSQVVLQGIREYVEDYERRKGGNDMAKVYYEDIFVGEVMTNRSLTVEEALEVIGFDEQKFIEDNGFDDIDPNDFKLVY
ncbi:hypothetical protein [Natribacillus halophilus]|uniref:Ribbon-helix-helix protein, copG family n=1 Tax=Natribacillus halophilus TaxID=549003 RepID=A0A1G8RRH7_9BACI|nr:hypothetical protein [Natribacillus halophilus]SDJ19566.1 hypothetical protein SAMN04488123_1205 [Natribacillus halophilus]